MSGHFSDNPQRGLPTTNIEGIRLLAHSFLFEVDAVLSEKSNNSFARWMDDIVIGMDERKEATETLSSISDILKSRGLALNLSKTNIYNDSEGYYHFQIEANRYIDSIEKTKITDEIYKDVCKELNKKFKKHLADPHPKYWDKIAKRYITTFAKLNLKSLLKDLAEIYLNFPSLRANLIFYLVSIGYNKETEKEVMKVLNSISIFDDISLYQLCNLVTQWSVPVNNDSDLFLKNFDDKINSISSTRKNSSDFYCVLWFKAKYSHPEPLLIFIERYQYIWHIDAFLRRQVTAILSRLMVHNSIKVIKLLNNQISSGINNTVTLANQIYYFLNANTIDQRLSFYLFPTNKQAIYPLSKFLVLCSVLNSETIRQDDTVKLKVLNAIDDPYYRRWLDHQYNIR